VLVGASGRGLRVPEELVVTGFDDIPMAALVTPPLTTVRQPVRELAARTARLLLQVAAGDAEEPDGGPVLPTELVIRGSCGCPTSTDTTTTTGRRRPTGSRRSGASRAGGGDHSEKETP
jgi:LacI family transcriptional regulator